MCLSTKKLIYQRLESIISYLGEGEESILIGVKSRDPPSIISSATSSNASVATTASTSALLGVKVKKYLKSSKQDKLSQKELNILLASQPDMEAGKKMEMEDPSVDKAPVSYSRGSLVKQVLAALAVSLGSMVVGFSSAFTAPALESMNDEDSRLHITDAEASWIGSLMPLSALFGGIIGGPFIENMGRRTTIVLTAIPFISSFLLIYFAQHVAMIMAGRSLTGLGVGIASLALPVYLGETVEARVRGTLGLLPTTIGNMGILISFVAGTYLDWTHLALLGACLPLPFFICTILIPETPTWFINKGKEKQAEASLQWLRGRKANVSEEMSNIVKAHKEAYHEQNQNVLKELFSKRYYLPFVISLGLMFFQQFSGINAVIFYTVTIFKESGSTIDSNLCSIIVGVVNIASTLVATVLIDKLGRKILLYISNALMTLTLLVLGVFFYGKTNGYDLESYGWVPLPAFVIFIFGFAIGAGPIPWLMMGEILPAKVRGTAASIVTAFNWTCTFIVTKTFIDMSKAFGTHSAFMMFALICAIGILFTYKLVPETQGRTLEDIENNLMARRESRMSIKSLKKINSLAYLKPFPSML
ncbi:facilitated trehalose transporter Tret1 isoform X2 [Halyomorpha halys]|uniref:facilitated trehalose transporter Tret1 isoform X2 n=1 Tax=Halyomorpha halys TaxID=286706 RepID=UPI0006D513BA